MIDAPLEKEVWVFPIYKYGTKKYIPMKYAILLAYLIPTLTIVLLSPFTTNNPALYQFEYILVAFFYGLLGVLTRSKLRSLLNVIPAFASYLTVQFVVQGLLNFKPPINDPYAMLNTASGPIKDLLNSFAPSFIWVTSYFFIFDLIIIFIFAEFIGLLTATISTGFWNPKGQFSVLAVIVKVIVIPLTLILIILLPIFFHGTASFIDGGSYFVAGANELSLAFSGGGGTGASLGGTAAQTSNIDVAALQLHAHEAAYFFGVSNDKFQNLKGNFLLQAIINYMTSTYPSLEPFKNITTALNLVGSIADISYVAPELILGINALTLGFQDTLSYISNATDTYDSNFAKGLTELNYAFNNLTLAWDKTDSSNNHHGIEQAIVRASTLQKIDSIGNYININDFVSALNTSVRTVLELGPAFVQFLNGTYETTVGLANLAKNKLTATNYWMDQSVKDFKLSNQTLGNITVPPKVIFELYPNGDGGASGKQSFEIPIQGIVQLAKDYNSLLIYFSYASLSSINMFDGMDGVLTEIGNLNWNNSAQAASSTFWSSVADSMTKVNTSYSNGINNLTLASNQAVINSQHSYGPLLDPAFKNGANSFSSLFNGLITNLQDNFVDYGHMLNALTYTTYAFRDFSLGSDQFSNWLTLYNDAGGYNATVNATGDIAIANFTSSMNFAYNGYLSLQKTVNMDATVKEQWSNMLYSPTNNGSLVNDPSVTGADYSGIVIIKTSTNPSNDPILNIITQLVLGDILGTG